MIELAQHIEALLLENDCVIVPGLGGFVAHYTPATRVMEENLFLPPTRVIGFNPRLKMNDGLLVQSYMATYGTHFSDATKIVDKTVQQLLATLHENGKADLPNIGELRYSIRDTYDFIPYDHKITTPYLYGLDSFEMKELAALPQPVRRTVSFSKPAAARETTRRNRRSISIRPSRIAGIAAMIAVIVLSFFFSTPIENTEVMEANYAQLLPAELMQQIENRSLAITPIALHRQPQTSKAPVRHKSAAASKKVAAPKNTTTTGKKKITPVAVKEVKVGKAATASSATAAQKTQPAQVAPAIRTPYHIIVASMATEKDAEDMVQQLVGKGFNGAKTIIGDGRMRVSIQSFSTQEEAYRSLNSLRQQEAYQNAWVLKK